MITTDFHLHPSIATVTMCRPDRRNALDAALVDALTGTIRDLGSREDIRVIVLTGDGPAFSAGADLAALHKLQSADLEENRADSRRLAGLFKAVLEAPVPVIARVNGHAIAGGCGLVAACDLAVAVDSALFGFSEVKIGFVPALVSTLLARRLSGSALRDLLLTGRIVVADEAMRLGLVGRVVDSKDLDEAVRDIAVSIARDTSRSAVEATKRLLSEVGELPMGQALEHAIEANARARGTRDCKDGVQAFLEHRDPPWRETWDLGQDPV